MIPPATNICHVAHITGVEVVSAIARRARVGDISQTDARRFIESFKRDFSQELPSLRLTDAVVADAMRLAESNGLRGYDAVQLATALELRNKLTSNKLPSNFFVSADDHLNQAAQSAGLLVENPNHHP
ncbi:MAG: type II toxin-antitoxin system VapC family toxin [Pyrinomonadaceae bacterium]